MWDDKTYWDAEKYKEHQELINEAISNLAKASNMITRLKTDLVLSDSKDDLEDVRIKIRMANYMSNDFLHLVERTLDRVE